MWTATVSLDGSWIHPKHASGVELTETADALAGWPHSNAEHSHMLPKPHLMMLSDICKARQVDGKTLPGSVRNTQFMMEFTISCSESCEFPLHLSCFQEISNSKWLLCRSSQCSVQQLFNMQSLQPSPSNPWCMVVATVSRAFALNPCTKAADS